MALSPPNDLASLLQAAVEAHRLGNFDRATAGYEQVLAIDSTHAIATQLLGTIALQTHHYDKARTLLTTAIQLDSTNGAAFHNLARLNETQGKLIDARENYHRAAELMPTNPDTSYSLANVLTALGELEESERWYRRTLAINPNYASAHRRLSRLLDHDTVDNDVIAMESLINHPATNNAAKIHLGFGLGKAYEDIQDYTKAFEYYQVATSLKRKQLRFSIDDWDNEVDKIIATFTPELLKQFENSGHHDARPIFILGMPRSGTSLVEQILASHSQVFGGGELQTLNHSIMAAMDVSQFPANVASLTAQKLKKMASDYMSHTAQISANAQLISDKKPDNFKLIGMIKIIFPNAIVIHSCRNPVDNCLSLFKNHFSENGPFYSYDLTELGRYYQGYTRLMDHWHKIMPGFIHDTHYEALVADVETGTQALLDFCQLEFEPACLEFHRTTRSVQTASAVQVRKSIYSSSVELWRRYEHQLAPLILALKK